MIGLSIRPAVTPPSALLVVARLLRARRARHADARLVTGLECGHCAMWAALPDELRQLVVAAFVRDATSSDLARAAPLSPAFLTAVRDEREQRTTPWRGGVWSECGEPPTPNVEIDPCWHLDDHDQPLTPADLERLIHIRACDSGDLEVVQRQIAKGVPVDFTSCLATPLYRAVSNGHSTCVRALLMARASLLDVCEEDRGAGIFSLALYKGHLNVVKVLTEFGVPRWGRTFDNECDGELWAAEYCGELTQEIWEFLVATRKFNPRAGDPAVYIPLQVEEKTVLLMEGNEEQQLEAVRALDFLAHRHNGWTLEDDITGLFFHYTCQLLPYLCTAVNSNRFEGQVLAAVLKLIQSIELEDEIKTLDEATGGALEELLTERPEGVCDDELLFVLRQVSLLAYMYLLACLLTCLTCCASRQRTVGRRTRASPRRQSTSRTRPRARGSSSSRGWPSCVQAPSWSTDALY